MLPVNQLKEILETLPDAETYPSYSYHVLLRTAKFIPFAKFQSVSNTSFKELKFVKEYEQGYWFWSLDI